MNGAIVDSAKVVAVVTTFRPDHGFVDRVRKTREQVNEVVIVDDGAFLNDRESIRRWFDGLNGVTVHEHESNKGLGVSLNMGVEIARRLGATWVVTLDDDSTVLPNMVNTLLRNWRLLKNEQRIGMLGMRWAEDGEDRYVTSFAGENSQGKKSIITSGSLTTIEVLNTIGPFRDDLFIDWLDYEYCARVRAKGYTVRQIQKVGFCHSLGIRRISKVGPWRIAFNSHSPLRTYYYFRNGLVVASEWCRHDGALSITICGALLREFLLVATFGDRRAARMKAAALGVRDAMSGRLGKCGYVF